MQITQEQAALILEVLPLIKIHLNDIDWKDWDTQVASGAAKAALIKDLTASLEAFVAPADLPTQVEAPVEPVEPAGEPVAGEVVS